MSNNMNVEAHRVSRQRHTGHAHTHIMKYNTGNLSEGVHIYNIHTECPFPVAMGGESVSHMVWSMRGSALKGLGP
jgi:hypothetical protein